MSWSPRPCSKPTATSCQASQLINVPAKWHFAQSSLTVRGPCLALERGGSGALPGELGERLPQQDRRAPPVAAENPSVRPHQRAPDRFCEMIHEFYAYRDPVHRNELNTQAGRSGLRRSRCSADYLRKKGNPCHAPHPRSTSLEPTFQPSASSLKNWLMKRRTECPISRALRDHSTATTRSLL